MQKTWNIGNTTVRNPNRIELGLKVFVENGFENNIKGKEQESAFTIKLSENGVIDSDGSNQDWLGRKWRSVFVKLGFITNSKYRINSKNHSIQSLSEQPEYRFTKNEYSITPIGRSLLDAQTTAEVNEIFLRQLLCLEIPSPNEYNYPDGVMKPFVLLLQLISCLNSKSQKGPTKDEIAIFLQNFQNHSLDLPNVLAEKIITYRKERNDLIGKREKRLYTKKCLEFAASKTSIKPNTLNDYADTTSRYSMMSGVLTYRHGRIEFRDEKKELINAILNLEPNFKSAKTSVEYLNDFYNGYPLPSDNLEYGISEIIKLSSDLNIKYNNDVKLDKDIINTTDIKKVNSIKFGLEEKLLEEKENKFAILQMQNDSITEIINTLEAFEINNKNFFSDIIDVPAYLEWITWRGFLAIDHIASEIYETRNFPLDNDLMPRHPSPGGRPDMQFKFENFTFVVEVTLTTSVRQVMAENEPIKRHIAKIHLDESNPNVYGIFIAPDIDNNILESFKSAYYIGDNPVFLEIIPLNIMQFKKILSKLLNQKFTPTNLKEFFDKCLKHRNMSAPEWKKKIDDELNYWLHK